MKKTFKVATTKVILLMTAVLASNAIAANQYQQAAPYTVANGYHYPYKDGTNGIDVYFGGLFGATQWTASIDYQDGTSDSSTINGGIGYTGTVGVMFSQYIGIQGSYLRYGDFDSTSKKSKTKESFYLAGPALDIKGVLPLENGFNIFGVLGFSSLTLHSNVNMDDDTQRSGLNFGIGGGYYFTPNVEASIQYYGTSISGFNGATLTPAIIGAGVAVHF